MREVILGKKNSVLWHRYGTGAFGKAAEEEYIFRALGEKEWFVDFFFFLTSKIKPRGGVGQRQKEGRNRSETTDRVMNENERIQKDYHPHPPRPHTPVL